MGVGVGVRIVVGVAVSVEFGEMGWGRGGFRVRERVGVMG